MTAPGELGSGSIPKAWIVPENTEIMPRFVERTVEELVDGTGTKALALLPDGSWRIGKVNRTAPPTWATWLTESVYIQDGGIRVFLKSGNPHVEIEPGIRVFEVVIDK